MWRASQTVSTRISKVSPRVTGLVSGGRPCSSKVTTPEEPKQPPPPPPPPPPGKGGGFFWKFLGLTLVGGSGVVGYAWYDKNFRKSIEDNIPYSKQALDSVFQYLPPNEEDKGKDTPKPSKSPGLAIDPEDAKKLNLQKRESDALLAPVEKSKLATKDDAKPTKAEIAAKKKEDEKKKKEEAKRQDEEKKRKEKESAERRLREKELEEAAENAALESILQHGLEDAEKVVVVAIELQRASAEATRAHTKQLKEAMDNLGTDKEKQWEKSTQAFSLKSDTAAKAESLADDARMELEKVRVALSEGKASKVTQKNKALRSTEQTINSLNYDLKTAITQNVKAQSEATVMKEYRDLVKKGKEQFRQEIESLTPEVSIGKKGGKLSEEELNSLIAHAHRRIEQLQRQLAEQMALEQLRIEAALDRQKEEDEKLAGSQVEQERERLQADFSLQKDKWDIDARVSFEIELRRQLARQAAAHSDHLAEVLKVQEGELKAKFNDLLTEGLIEERDKFKADVAGWIARLKGIEAAVEGRADMEKQGRKAQELWLACQMLHNLIESGPDLPDDLEYDDLLSYETLMRPLLDELMSVLEAGNNHPFVNSVLETIPDEAVKRGVWTEKALLDRFKTVRRVCRRVAMIDETGGSLFRYFLSYAQSFFIFSTSKPLSEADKADPSQLSTFVLLDNAYHYIEHGDLEQALRFMNQLNGEPRRVASDWIDEARLLLETRQAADALLAHASGNGLGALF